MADADLFSGMKKVKKSKKKVDFGDLDDAPEAAKAAEPAPAPKAAAPEPAAPATVDPVVPLQPSADLTLPDSEELDFSNLKKKKSKAKVALSLEDIEAPATDKSAPSESTDAAMALDDFSDLKKKKKGKKAAFDLDAFEKEIEAVASSEAAARDGHASDDDVPEGNDEAAAAVEGDDPFSKDGEGADIKSRAEIAYEKKAWVKDNRDYQYPELLGRFYALLYASHPGLSGAAKKRYTIPPPQMVRDGNKRSIFANVVDICKKMHRQPEHVIQFLFAELGTTGSVDGSGRLVIKGRFQQRHMEAVLRSYIMEYVTCKTCKSPDTLLEKDNRLFFVTCQSCQSRRSVASINSGFRAIATKRKAMPS